MDFIFTGAATRLLRDAGVREVRRVRLGSAAAWYATLLLSGGLVQLYAVCGRKEAPEG